MKITLKTLKGQQLPLDVETTMTVSRTDTVRVVARSLCSRVYVTNDAFVFFC